MPGELPERKNVNDDFKWDLNDIYKSTAEWEEDFKKVETEMEKIKNLQGDLVLSSEKLYSGLNQVMELEKVATRVFVYAHLSSDQDTRNQENQALLIKAQDLSNRIGSITSFMVPEILQLSCDDINKYYEKTPELEKYRHFLDNIFRMKEHYLTPREEQLLAQAGNLSESPENIFSMLNNADLTFPVIKDEDGKEVRITHGRYTSFLKSADRRVRKDAFKGLYSKYTEFNNTFASTLNAEIKSHIYYRKARNYNSSLEAALDDDRVPVQVYENLIKTVRDNLEPMYKYISLRKKILDLDELHMYDIYNPLLPDMDIKIDYNEAVEIVLKALQPLGEEYLEIMKNGLQSRWIDIYENKGKRSGAYSSGCYGVHPYVLLNYNDEFSDLFTLAHEMGHALHSYLSNQNQPFIYARYKIFLAEVASTMNETLLINYLLDNAEEEEKKKYLINYYLDQFRGTVYRQTMFAEFEKIIHEKVEAGQPLTAGLLNQIYSRLNSDYYGGDIVVDDEIGVEWSRVPHFYYNFYVYKYVTGYSAATALAGHILENGQPAVDKYLKFLKSGDSDYPLNILQKAGVDMSQSDPVEKAIGHFSSYLKKLEEII